ncbi:PilZ domain-containing protein [bacterium]|nr:PilZ domain-containing protein [bacterium]
MLNVFSKLRSFLLGQEIIESERRRAVRIPCRLKAAVEGLGAPVNVVNLSVLGMRVEATGRLRKNIVVVVEGREYPGKPLSARVIWCQTRGSQYLAGLMFVGSNEEKNTSWVKGALDKLGASQNRVKERRAHIRVPTEGIAYLSNRSGDRLCEGQLRNVGLGGALFLSEIGVQAGTTVRLQLDTMGRPKLDEPATVRSCRKDVRSQQFLVGIQFADTGTDAVRKFLKQIHK